MRGAAVADLRPRARAEPGQASARQPQTAGARSVPPRERVYSAALELFVEQGFDSTTIDEIAERAGVARATVFYHFKPKTAILDEWSARRRQRAVAAVGAEHLQTQSLRDVLTRYTTALAEINENARAETVALMSAAIRSTDVLSNPRLAPEVASFISRAQRTEEVRADFDPADAGLLVATAYVAILGRWIAAEPPPFDLRRTLLATLELLFEGLSPR
jgi:AcrR family transcriptional regulator